MTSNSISDRIYEMKIRFEAGSSSVQASEIYPQIKVENVSICTQTEDQAQQSEPLKNRIERLSKALFVDINGLSIFLMGVKSLRKLIEIVGISEIAPTWFDLAGDIRDHIKEFQQLASCLKVRQILYNPSLLWKELKDKKSLNAIAIAVGRFATDVALPMAVTAHFLASNGLIANPNDLIGATSKTVILVGTGIKCLTGSFGLISNFSTLGCSERVKGVAGIAFGALLWSSESLEVARRNIPQIVRNLLKIADGLGRLANLCVVSWKTPVSGAGMSQQIA